MSKSRKWLSERLNKVNELEGEMKLSFVADTFKIILDECDLFIVPLKETTDEELSQNKARPYIETLPNFENKSYLKIFTDEPLAKDFARKTGNIKDGKEFVLKVTKEQLIYGVKDAFMMIGLDGIIISDENSYVTISSEEFLYIGICKVLKLEKAYDPNFINTVRCIFDIKYKRYRLCAPFKVYEGISKDDVLSGKAKEYPLNNELLILEYYDKYKVEKIFNNEAFFVDLDIETLLCTVKKAVEDDIEKINIVYAGKQAFASPKDILGLLEVIV